jgi:hypothetical protein
VPVGGMIFSDNPAGARGERCEMPRACPNILYFYVAAGLRDMVLSHGINGIGWFEAEVIKIFYKLITFFYLTSRGYI